MKIILERILIGICGVFIGCIASLIIASIIMAYDCIDDCLKNKHKLFYKYNSKIEKIFCIVGFFILILLALSALFGSLYFIGSFFI